MRDEKGRRVAVWGAGAAVAVALVAGAPGQARADMAVNMIAGGTAAIVAAGFLGEYLRGDDPFSAGPDEPFRLTFGAGAHNVYVDNGDDWGNSTAGMARLEARLPYKLWRLTPLVGMEVTHRGSFYGYSGFMLDVWFGDNFIVSPNAVLGYYNKGDGRDLGYPLEFRTGLEFAYQLDDGSRLGLAAHHISNANLGGSNPGVENVTFNYSIPFDQLFSK